MGFTSNVYSSTWSDQHKRTSLGQVSNIKLKNIKVISSTGGSKLYISGCKDTRTGYDNELEHAVRDIFIDNMSINGVVLNSDSPNIILGDYVYNVNVGNNGEPITGANSAHLY